jgi:hypothetical protein
LAPPSPRSFGIMELGGQNTPKSRFQMSCRQNLDNKGLTGSARTSDPLESITYLLPSLAKSRFQRA